MQIPDGWLADGASDLKASILFLTRLPLPRTSVNGAAIARAAWAFPIAGILVGLIGGLIYALAHKLGVPPWPAAALSIVATLLATGCLHEDGLADTVDGFGGGATRERKLEIMRDSQIGTYGVCAVTLSIVLRASALASLASPTAVLMALIAAHGAARATLPAFMMLVPPARNDGLSYAVGRPPQGRVIAAGVIGIAILAFCLGPTLAISAVFVLAVFTAIMAATSLAQIDGQTGDVLGALEQVCEIAILFVALR